MFAQTSLTHIIILFIGLDFDGSLSQAAFISICLDTIYYQLFILVFSPLCLTVFLFVGCWVFRQSRHASLSVTLLLQVFVTFLPVLREKVCLVCHFIYPFLLCVGVRVGVIVCEPGLVLTMTFY